MQTLSLQHLVKIYRGRRVVDDVSMNVAGGHVTGLLGPNGAGKTTTFYMAVGMVAPNEGTVLLDEEDITDCPMHISAQKGVGYLPQESSVFRKLTVRDNLLAVLQMMPLSKTEQEERTTRLLEELGIAHVATPRKPGFFRAVNGGVLKLPGRLPRTRPSCCWMNPLRELIRWRWVISKKLLIILNRKESEFLISDHNVRETLSVCDTAYILSSGMVIESGPPEKIAPKRNRMQGLPWR